VKVLRDECGLLSDAVRLAGLASPEVLAANRPGGESNPDKGPRGWLRFYAVLHRLHAKQEHTASSDQHAQDDGMAMAALASREEAVRLMAPPPGAPEVLYVYPKSHDALLRITSRDSLLGLLADRRTRLHRSLVPADRELLVRLDAETAHQLQTLIWQVTHPGPWLPDGERPEWLSGLDVLDLHRLIRAHQIVNGYRLKALQSLTSPSEGGKSAKRPAFSVYISAIAAEQGIPPHQMLRDWSLSEVLMAGQLSAQAKRDAHDAAKADRQRAPAGRSGF
jgi:hypothetical protein